MRHYFMAAAAAVALTGCGSGETGTAEPADGAANTAGTNAAGANASMAEAHGASAAGASGTAVEQSLRAADGAARGTVSVAENPQGLVVRVAATGLPAGPHGVHVHAVGRCDAPDFSSAGPHWNPTNNQHGTENPQGPHMGDLPNMNVAQDGTGTLEFALPGARLRGGEPVLLDADGAALVVHAQADDYRTEPSGSSGDRIACAVLGPAG